MLGKTWFLGFKKQPTRPSVYRSIRILKFLGVKKGQLKIKTLLAMVPGRPGRGPGPGGACQVGRGSGPAGGGAPIFSRGAAPPGPGPQYSAGARPRRGRGPVLWPGRGAPPGQTPGPGRPCIQGFFYHQIDCQFCIIKISKIGGRVSRPTERSLPSERRFVDEKSPVFGTQSVLLFWALSLRVSHFFGLKIAVRGPPQRGVATLRQQIFLDKKIWDTPKLVPQKKEDTRNQVQNMGNNTNQLAKKGGFTPRNGNNLVNCKLNCLLKLKNVCLITEIFFRNHARFFGFFHSVSAFYSDLFFCQFDENHTSC